MLLLCGFCGFIIELGLKGRNCLLLLCGFCGFIIELGLKGRNCLIFIFDLLVCRLNLVLHYNNQNQCNYTDTNTDCNENSGWVFVPN